MNTSCRRYRFIFFIVFFLMGGADLRADTQMKIAIFPFTISASASRPELSEQITRMISDKIQQEGAAVIFPEPRPDMDKWDLNQLKTYGIQAGVDYLLTGSVFAAGESISIDTRLINVYDQGRPRSLFTESDRLENLFASVTQLSKEIIGEVYQKKIITEIAVNGNKRIEKDAILRIIESRTGDIVKPDSLSKDLKKIYDMGYFDDVSVEKESHDQGARIIFNVQEKPSIREIRFKKNKVYKTEELKDSINIKTGSILNIHILNANVERIKLLYTEKNYHNCLVSYEIVPLEHSQADIMFTIEEGEKIRVEEIVFEGNQYFPDKKLKKVMETSEKGLFSFLTYSGNLNETEARNDAVRIESLYKNNGFIDAKVSDPEIRILEDHIAIRFKIDEGLQYKIKSVDISGDLILEKQALLKEIKSKKDALYNREEIRNDMNHIADLYSQKGYANVRVDPMIRKDETEPLMAIEYVIEKGVPVHFNRVNISGNVKTRDKVIRREIKIAEQDLYDKKKIERSFKDLHRLDYFSEIDMKPVKTQTENEMNLDVKVVEKTTGLFSFGGGVSSEEGVFGMISVEERNLFGRGQTARLTGRISTEDTLFELSFLEPYLLDTHISSGFKLYREELEYEYYDKEGTGLTLMFGYGLFDYVKIGANYNIEDFEITNVETEYTNMTQGSFLTSSIKPYISYDSRDDYFLPTEGSKHSISIEYAGEFLGGEIDYTKYLAETSFYFPLFWKFTGTLHAEAGYFDDRTSDDINVDYAKFYLGGMRSIRGFDKYDISGKRPGEVKDRGGEKYVQFNAELTFPITDQYRVAGVFFYDRGDVYRTSENIRLDDQFSSVGAGLRWHSPMGPLRIEYGWVLEGKDVKNTGDGQFAFSVGASF